jgi:hypothetical protein
VDIFSETEREQGPSWARDNWPLTDLDEVNAGLDPTRMTIEKVAARAKEAAGSAGKSEAEIRQAAEDSIRAMMLIRTYRVRGHLAADLDPLGLAKRELPADLTPEYHGFTGAALDRPVYLGGTMGFETATVRELVECLRRNYCGHIGLEYMHINDLEERRFLQDRMEGKHAEIRFTPEGKKSILQKVIEAEQWEKFLARKYVGTKRFGLDGGEAMVPALESVIKYGGQYGVREIVFGMAHRGRLNVLANVMGKPYRVIFNEFAGGSANPEDVGGSGDVKYHLGTSSDREFRRHQGALVARPQPQPPRSGRSGRARQGARRSGDAGRYAGERGSAGAAARRRRLRRPGHRRRVFRLLRPSRLRDRRHDPFRDQQSGGLHHLARLRPLIALPFGHRQVSPGADPARQRRRSGSGDLRLQARHRISADVQARHRHRHVVLSPLRPQ